jgi:hypothetical protein
VKVLVPGARDLHVVGFPVKLVVRRTPHLDHPVERRVGVVVHHVVGVDQVDGEEEGLAGLVSFNALVLQPFSGSALDFPVTLVPFVHRADIIA